MLGLVCVVVQLYEAYVIYAFVQYLISHMGNEEQLIAKLQTKPAVLGKHMVPFCCLPPWTMGAEFLTKCKIGESSLAYIHSGTSASSDVAHLMQSH